MPARPSKVSASAFPISPSTAASTLEADKSYKVAGWASVNPQTGKPVAEVFAKYLRGMTTAQPKKLNRVALKGVANNPGISG